ncbi:transcription factor E4F1-like isoform X2 [Echinops telfairi]|uniref:Transcription factor E4F1-like isoform X2 n=1 Tax=Echinops telfairi TaxID=9371 RepID=A0AC55CNQ5_ECHTE|nr:transcription factor E4F1-like isoform X2 [Echinops telfairi]
MLSAAPLRARERLWGLASPGPTDGTPTPHPDEDDVHRCGRCQAEFTTVEDFVQHKLQKGCQRAPLDALPTTPEATELLGSEVVQAPASEEPLTLAHIVVEAASLSADLGHAPDLVGKWDHVGLFWARCAGCGWAWEGAGVSHQPSQGSAGEGDEAGAGGSPSVHRAQWARCLHLPATSFNMVPAWLSLCTPIVPPVPTSLCPDSSPSRYSGRLVQAWRVPVGPTCPETSACPCWPARGDHAILLPQGFTSL